METYTQGKTHRCFKLNGLFDPVDSDGNVMISKYVISMQSVMLLTKFL